VAALVDVTGPKWLVHDDEINHLGPLGSPEAAISAHCPPATAADVAPSDRRE
jgi:hypothetical protein